MLTSDPGMAAAIVTVVGAVAAVLSAVAVYVRSAAKALEARNVSLDALGTAAANTTTRVDIIEKDNNAAHARLRALENRVAELSGNPGSVPEASRASNAPK